MLQALREKDLATVDKLYNSGYEWSGEEYSEAYRHVECLQFLLTHDGFIPSEAIKLAAIDDNLESIIYMHEVANVLWHTDTLNIAASKGNLTLLTYAHTHGCKESAPPESILVSLTQYKMNMTAEHAATNGHLDCLQYAVENIEERPLITTEEALEFTRTYPNITRDMADNITRYKQIMSTFFAQQKIAVAAAKNGHLDCLKYCLQTFDNVNQKVAIAALENNQMNCFAACLEKAAQSGQKFDVDQILDVLNRLQIDMDFDKYPIFRTFFKLIDTIETRYSRLHQFLVAKRESIDLQKQYSLLDENIQMDVRKHVLLSFM